MNIKINMIFSLFILSTLFSCDNEKSNINKNCTIQTDLNGMKIMPLGDSRVEGSKPGYESYRYELWKNLMENNWEFDFIGTRKENFFYSDYDGICFDLDHEGRIGALTEDILQNVMELPTDMIPDVVLLGIGINDLTNPNVTVEESITNIDSIIDNLQIRNNNIIIFLEKIPPPNASITFDYFNEILNQFNDSIINIGVEQTDENSSVFIVDMFTDWSNDYLVDDLHYNQEGAKYIADKYFESMELNL